MFKAIQRIMSAEEAADKMPVPDELRALKARRDKDAADIVRGESKKLLMIVGPCSADNPDAVLEYVSKLAKIQDAVKDKLFIIPRIYTNKPRTRGEGYKGMLFQPDPNSRADINKGILQLRGMHLRVMSETGLTAADEMLYPDNYAYVSDILTYNTVGARSAENQQHRLVASGIDGVVGIKNPMNGSFSVLLNSIYAAQIPNEFNYGGTQVATDGNPLAHAVLRGSVNDRGESRPNYHYEDIVGFSERYISSGLKNPAIIIDTNHSNSGKDAFAQPRIVSEVLENRSKSAEFGRLVRGFMVESYILDGAQPPDGGVYGKSITDACLGFEKTERLLLDAAERV